MSKPSPAKRPNLNNSLGRIGNHLNNSNGIEMESEEEEIDDDDENEIQIPSPKVIFYPIIHMFYFKNTYLFLYFRRKFRALNSKSDWNW